MPLGGSSPFSFEIPAGSLWGARMLGPWSKCGGLIVRGCTLVDGSLINRHLIALPPMTTTFIIHVFTFVLSRVATCLEFEIVLFDYCVIVL